MRVIICTSKSHLGLNIAIKLTESLIDSCMVFFGLLGRLQRLIAKLLLAGDGKG